MDLAPLAGLPGDRIGFARIGVPHVVIRCPDAGDVDLERTAPHFRHHPALRDGANVNVASRTEDGVVTLRTFERGVEAETLACGTGSVATALLLAAWETGDAEIRTTETAIGTRSGLRHRVRTRPAAGDRPPRISLAGTPAWSSARRSRGRLGLRRVPAPRSPVGARSSESESLGPRKRVRPRSAHHRPQLAAGAGGGGDVAARAGRRRSRPAQRARAATREARFP